MKPERSWRGLTDLLLITAAFVGALLLYNAVLDGGLTREETWIGCVASIFAFWIATQLKEWDSGPETWTGVYFVEQFCFGTGINLLLHALMTYAFRSRRTPFLVISGSLFSALLLAAARAWRARTHPVERRVLLIGFDAVAARVMEALEWPIAAIVREKGEDVESALRASSPTHIIISADDWSRRISASTLFHWKQSGGSIEDVGTVYERIFARVCCQRLQPINLLLSASLRGDSRTMAIQAVYTNLVGLFLLLLFAPVILAVALAVALFSGPGPVFESVECAGFQYIPFHFLRFRTTRRDGSITKVGRIIRALRLAKLPQLINVVRGDMALVGPIPVRREFALHITELMPFYSHRFSVKPGILGWAQMHAPRHGVADECTQVEYDLYYVREGSLWLDAEIVGGSLMGAR